MKKFLFIMIIAAICLTSKAQQSVVLKSSTKISKFALDAYPKIIFEDSKISFTNGVDSIAYHKGEHLTMYISKETLKGDVDNNGVITLNDARMVTNRFLGFFVKNFNEDAADVNGDGKITIADANAIVNICLDKK